MYMSMIHSKGLDPIIGEHLEKYLRELDSYNDINARCVPLILPTDQQRAGPQNRQRLAFELEYLRHPHNSIIIQLSAPTSLV